MARTPLSVRGFRKSSNARIFPACLAAMRNAMFRWYCGLSANSPSEFSCFGASSHPGWTCPIASFQRSSVNGPLRLALDLNRSVAPVRISSSDKIFSALGVFSGNTAGYEIVPISATPKTYWRNHFAHPHPKNCSGWASIDKCAFAPALFSGDGVIAYHSFVIG